MIKQYSDIDKHVHAQELDHQIQEFLAKGGVIKQCEYRLKPSSSYKPKKHKRLTEHQTVIKLQAMLKKGTVMQDEFVALNSTLSMTKAMTLVRKRTGWHISKITTANGVGYKNMTTAKGCGYKVRGKK